MTNSPSITESLCDLNHTAASKWKEHFLFYFFLNPEDSFMWVLTAWEILSAPLSSLPSWSPTLFLFCMNRNRNRNDVKRGGALMNFCVVLRLSGDSAERCVSCVTWEPLQRSDNFESFTARWLRLSRLCCRDAGWDEFGRSLLSTATEQHWIWKHFFARVKVVWDQTARVINSGADVWENTTDPPIFPKIINDLTSGVTPEASNYLDSY